MKRARDWIAKCCLGLQKKRGGDELLRWWWPTEEGGREEERGTEAKARAR